MTSNDMALDKLTQSHEMNPSEFVELNQLHLALVGGGNGDVCLS